MSKVEKGFPDGRSNEDPLECDRVANEVEIARVTARGILCATRSSKMSRLNAFRSRVNLARHCVFFAPPRPRRQN